MCNVRIGNRTRWNDVNLMVRPGEFVSVLGPNGVGKSTMVKAVLGLLPLSAGLTSVNGSADRRGFRPRRSYDLQR
jgi:zinc/manganese transport system ATP-binding protein